MNVRKRRIFLEKTRSPLRSRYENVAIAFPAIKLVSEMPGTVGARGPNVPG
jgi:hypothetical protein